MNGTTFNIYFWRLSKTSDASYEEHILKDYDMMEDFIKKYASGNEGIKADLTRYLGRLRKNMKQWGGVYIFTNNLIVVFILLNVLKQLIHVLHLFVRNA